MRRPEATPTANQLNAFAPAARWLQNHPGCRAEIVVQREPDEADPLALARAKAVQTWLVNERKLPPRLRVALDTTPGRTVTIKLHVADQP